MTLKNINKYPQQARLLDFMFYQNMKPGQLGVFKTSFCRKHFHVKHAVFSETTRKLQVNSKFHLQYQSPKIRFIRFNRF